LPERGLGVILLVAAAVLVVLGFVAYLVVYRPLRLLGAREEELTRLTATDAMTGLLNRTSVLARMRMELGRVWRSGEPLSCALVDIDRLQSINNDYGHDAGDSVIRSIGNLIGETCREYDSAGRYSAEKFLIIFPSTELDDAARGADRLRQRVESGEFSCNGQALKVTVSIGVTESDADTPETIDQMVGRAHRALDQAKEQGRNRVSAVTTIDAVERAVTTPSSAAST
jgi:diguanylate cyclase (GGDEF)-like protein